MGIEEIQAAALEEQKQAQASEDELDAALSKVFDGEDPDAEPEEETNQTESSEGQKAENEEAPAEEPKDNTDQADVAKGDEHQDGTIEAPKSWSAEEKQLFAQLPPETQSIIARRESERDKGFTTKSQELAKKYEDSKAVADLIDREMPNLKAQGITAQQGIQQMIELNKFAQRDPAGYIKHVAGLTGVDLRTLVPKTQEPQGDVYTDPAMTALQNEITSLKNAVSSQIHNAEAAQHHDAQNTITDFENAKDEAGNLKHPHFQEVRGVMGMLIESGQAQDIQSAYDQAVRANPTTFAAMQEAEGRDRKAKEALDAQARVKKARSASASISGADEARSDTLDTNDLDAVLEQAYNETVGKS